MLLRRFALLLTLGLTAGCFDPLADLPIGSGEVYIVHESAQFAGGFVSRGRSATPQLCPVRGADTVPSCTRDARLPQFVSTSSQEITVDGIDYKIHRTILPAAGRYAFFRAYMSSRRGNFRETARFYVDGRTTVFDIAPNAVLMFPVWRSDPDAVARAAADGIVTSTEMRNTFKKLSTNETSQIARAVIRQAFGEAGQNLSYHVGQTWSTQDLDGNGFRLTAPTP